MDYNNHRCPVCEKQFENGDDIVVCPICGAPHHRECYELEMRCHYQNRHKDGYDYKKEFTGNEGAEPATADGTLCAYCGNKNPEGSKFCNSCGAPIGDGNAAYQPYDRHTEESTPPYSSTAHRGENRPQNEGQSFEPFAFDPMGGVKADEDIGDGVTAGEASKFVKTNTPLYTRIFYSIKKYDRSRFNFAGFIFSGGWMLYRKMYKLGTIVTALMAVLFIAQLYMSNFYGDLFTRLNDIANSSGMFVTTEAVNAMQDFVLGLETDELMAIGVSYFASLGLTVIRFVVGACGNRWYYKHCVKKIASIKSTAETKEAADAELQTKGGVNTALAVSLMISYMILTFLPYLF